MKKKKLFFLIPVVSLCLLTGCKANELEEVVFPLLAAVDYKEDTNKIVYCDSFSRPMEENADGEELPYTPAIGETFVQAKERYEGFLQKVPDYNHLKILLLGENLLKNEQAYQDMIAVLAETEEFPRNTYICVTDDIEHILETATKLSEDVGSYLENYLENHKQTIGTMISLGDLINEQENQALLLHAPYFKAENHRLEMQGQYLLTGET